MKQLYIPTRDEWRSWLAGNHDSEAGGIWLVFYKKETGKPSIEYDDAVEEALCFGWIDSIIKKIDEETYCRKFTPRKNGSVWSELNKRRVEKTIREGRMTEFGLAKVEEAKKSGMWDKDQRPVIGPDSMSDLSEALARNERANAFFETLAPSYKRQFMGWIASAKRPETRAKRIAEAVDMLARGKKLGI